MKPIYLAFFIFFMFKVYPQSVIITTDNSAPDVSAMLDIKSTNKGLLLPRVALTGINDITTVPNAANGLFVFSENGNVPDGLYYWNKTATKWIFVVTSNSITDFGSGKVITNEERTKLTNDADASVTNEIQTLTLSGNQLTISSGNNVTYTGWDTNTGDDFSADERTKLNGIETGADKTPAGTILPFGGTTLPTGYLWCDGSEVSKSAYPVLSAAIGTAWGTGANSDYFKLPDLRGYFLRGVDNMDNTVGTGGGAAGHDPDAASRTALQTGGNSVNNVGSLQNDELNAHNHNANVSGDGSHVHTIPFVRVGTQKVYAGGDAEWIQGAAVGVGGNGAHTHTVSIGDEGGTETRPKNVYVNYIIKY